MGWIIFRGKPPKNPVNFLHPSTHTEALSALGGGGTLVVDRQKAPFVAFVIKTPNLLIPLRSLMLILCAMTLP